MKRILIAAAGVAAIGAAIGLQARYLSRRQVIWRARLTEAIPVNSKFWREHGKQPGELLYVAIGDSAAQGIGASRPDHSYVGVVAKRIRQLTDHPVRVVNLGISGATVAIALESELPVLAKLSPDIVTVSIGANDIANFDPVHFGLEINTLFEALPDHAIVADLPSFYFLPARKKVRVANDIIRRAAAARGLVIAPLHSRTNRQGLWGVSTQFAGDLFHPNDRGYRVWASAFAPAIEQRMDALSSRRPSTPADPRTAPPDAAAG